MRGADYSAMRAATIVAVLTLAGCARLSTERARYVEGDVIDVHFDNVGPTMVRFWPCYPYLERRVGDRWQPAEWADPPTKGRHNPLGHMCVLVNYHLPPDERATFRLTVPPGSPSGMYRFYVELRHGHEPEPLYSPPFRWLAADAH
jgi:hypothetical protein